MASSSLLDGFSLSDPQRAAVLARGCDVAVTAGAGTGKTRTLVARYLALLADGIPLRRIVAVTFTRKAAREMRNRVRLEIGNYLRQESLDPAAADRWQSYYNELDAARIGTIHNLCGEILRTHPAEAGIDPRFTVLDETQAALLMQETVEAALAWAVNEDRMTPLFGLLRERPLRDLIITLLSQRAAVQAVVDKLPAGSIYDIWQSQLQAAQAALVADMLSAPDFQAAVRFLTLNAAAAADDKREMQRRAALAALDFPVAASLADKLRSLNALTEIKLIGGSKKNWPGGEEQLNEVKEALKTVREAYTARPLLNQRLNAQDEAVAAVMPAIYALAAYARHTYQARKAKRDALDFDDLEALAMALLQNNPATAAYWQEQIRAMLVDEFQDTNEQQRQFIRLLCPDGAGSLFIVGDAKQSIYRFRGADVVVFAAEKERIGGHAGRLIDLDTSYRAHETLLAGMNYLLQPVLGEDGPQRPPWAAPFAPLVSGGKAANQNLTSPFIEFHLTLGAKGEALPCAAAALALRLAQLHHDNGLDFGQMAILCRASSAFQYYENALDAAGIPYLTVAGKGFYDRPEIRDLLNGLQAIADPHDDLALVGLLRSPACGLSDVALYHLGAQRPAAGSLWTALGQGLVLTETDEAGRLQTAVSLIHDLHQQAGRVPVADLFKQFLDRTFYRAILRRTNQPRALRNVNKLLADIHASELVGVAEFLEFAQTLRDSGSREGEARATAGGAVQIMSIHAAKGLEFPVVALGDAGGGSSRTGGVLVDANLGILLPNKNEAEEQAASYQMAAALAKQQEEAETARLLYVALTRAEQMLLISGTGTQNQSGSVTWGGWLKPLADITGMAGADLSGYDEEGDERHHFAYLLAQTAVGVTIYEPSADTSAAPRSPVTAVPAMERPLRFSLQEPLFIENLAEPVDSETPQRVWQVVPTARRPEAPAWVVGSIVHEALALWRFPGESFDAWTAARAREYGLTDAHQLQHAQAETVRLLRQFRQSPLCREIEAAERRLHEVPYSYRQNGVTETGYIDLLFLRDGVWTLVDFKTDQVQHEGELQRLLKVKDYRGQVRRYGTAVGQLMGLTPRLLLCFLNFGSDVFVMAV